MIIINIDKNHVLGISTTLIFFILGFVLLHLVINSSEEVYFFFDIYLSRNMAMDLGFLSIGAGIFILYWLYFAKSKNQVITFTGNNNKPLNVQLANHELDEVILIVRPTRTHHSPKVHLATKNVRAIKSVSIPQLVQELGAQECLTIDLQKQEERGPK